MRSYSLYLSSTGVNKPLDKTNLAQLKWSINWKEIFGSRNIGECRVRVRFLSNSSTLLSWNNNVGSLRGSFQSNTSNSSNGLNIGFLRPSSDNTTATPLTSYLECDTDSSNGLSMVIPNSNSDFYITLLNSEEKLMLNVPEYQIWLYFDVDDENPTEDKTLFYPR